MVAAVYRRSDFLSRLLLLAAHAAQGSTSCDTDGVANMTKDSFFDDGSDREKRRDVTTASKGSKEVVLVRGIPM